MGTPRTGRGRRCSGRIGGKGGKQCPRTVTGQAQLCDDCKAARFVCQEPGCGEPHGGIPGQTRYCPPHRAKHRAKPHKPYNPAWTPEEDAIIRETYAAENSHDAPRLLRERWPTRPRWSVTRRAQHLGAATIRKKEPRWVAEEDAILRELAWMSPERLVLKLKAKGYHRSVTAVCLRMRRTGTREHIDGMTARAVARMLDVDDHAVTGWVKAGWLAAERRSGSGDARDKHYITTAAIQAFLWAHPEVVVLSRLERVGSKMWFLELVSGGRISEHEDPADGKGAIAFPVGTAPVGAGPAAPARTFPLYGERVSVTALAEIAGRSAQAILHRIDGLGMSVEDAAFGLGDGGEGAGAAANVTPTPLGAQVGKALRALLRKHKAKPADLVTWTKLPEPIVAALLAGTTDPVVPALVRAAEILDAEVEVHLVPRPRSYETA